MSVYLKEFSTHSEYENYINGSGTILPNVSICTTEGDVHYNPVSPLIDNAVITCDSATYNGQTQVATNIVVTLNGDILVNGTDYTISNNDGGINAGDYTFMINGIGNYSGSKNGTFTISKVTPTVVIPVAKVLTYLKGVAQELVTAGSTDFGTMKYSTDGETYSTSVPSKTRAGLYTVYYFVEGDSNVNSTEATTVACSINEKPVTATIELSQGTYTYDGTAKEPTVTVKDGGDIIDPYEYTVIYSNNTNAGTASVTITDNTAGDYNVSGVTTFTIDKINQSAPTATGATTTYPTTASAIASGGGGQGSLEWESAQSQTSVGSHTTRARWSGNSNYNTSPWSNSVTVKMNKAQGSVTTPPTAKTGLTPTGSAQALINAGSGTGTMMYNLNGGAWSSSIPTATNIGTYTVGYKAAESANYTESTTGSVSVEIGYPYVDLGLPSGTKWAKYNVGATSETGYGNYYKYGKGSTTYNSSDGTYKGTEDPLNLSVDTARQVMGGNWRMPTQTQLNELKNNTTYEWTTINGVNGYKFTATNSSYVFFPASGSYSYGELTALGSAGLYWSSTPINTQLAYRMGFNNSDVNVQSDPRSEGGSIRGVINE